MIRHTEISVVNKKKLVWIISAWILLSFLSSILRKTSIFSTALLSAWNRLSGVPVVFLGTYLMRTPRLLEDQTGGGVSIFFPTALIFFP